MCFSIRLDNDGESHPADIAQLLSARALRGAASGEIIVKYASSKTFQTIDGQPIAHWLSEQFRSCFTKLDSIKDVFKPAVGLNTGDNDRFLRHWFEVAHSKIFFAANSIEDAAQRSEKWFPYNKGGGHRKWYGNQSYVINWLNDGKDVKELATQRNKGKHWSRYIQNLDKMFLHCVTWSDISTSSFAARLSPKGFLFDVKGSSGIPHQKNDLSPVLSLLCSNIMPRFMQCVNPTSTFQVGDLARVPYAKPKEFLDVDAEQLATVRLAKDDWNAFETSWSFSALPLLDAKHCSDTLKLTYANLRVHWQEMSAEMLDLEKENNRIFIEAYGLQDELTPEVPLSEITLTCNPHYRYGGDLADEEREAKLKSDTMRELISYAIGCIMGRYSLAEPGLIYAHSGGIGFDPSRYGAFPSDDDGIIPLTEEQWFADDASARIEQFLGVAWPAAPVMETLATLMDGLSMGKAGEPREALRSYMSKQFYKDHLQTYKNRPIYWLFSSGKQKAFEALVYLHRYNEGTLARMRTVYVTPLMGKLQQRMVDLKAAIDATSSSAEETRLKRERDKLAKQVVELRVFDEELRHFADQRIALDLDDGVKVNYARFGNLLAAKDKVCPKKKGEGE